MVRRPGSVFKRCPHGITGTSKENPACPAEDGSWWWRAEASRDASTGKRKQPARGGYTSPKEASDALIDHLAQRNKGTWADDKRTTVGEWLEWWVEDCARRQLEPKTVAGYRGHLRVLIPALGHHRLRDLGRHHVEEMIADLARPTVAPPREPRPAGLKPRCEAITLAGQPCSRTAAAGSAFCGAHGGRLTGEQPSGPGRGGRTVPQRMPRTVDGYRRTLRAALAVAKRRKLVEENVAEGTIDNMPRIGQADTAWWEPEQVARFLASIEGHRLYALYQLAAFAGLRRGELLGLRWDSVDLTGDVPGLTVTQTVSGLAGTHACVVCGSEHTGRRIKLKPKTDAGRRWVPLVGVVVAALTAHREAQDVERREFGEAYGDHHLVFAQEDGVPLRPDAVTKEFETLAGDLPKIRLHDQRHGAASLLLAAGTPVEVVAMILGHANPQVTRGVYAHVLRGPAMRSMEAAAALVHLPASVSA